MSEPEQASRRSVLGAVAAAGLVAPVLTACGSGDGTGDTAGTEGGSAPSDGSSGSGGGAIPTSEIPVGGGKIFPDRKLVVTQPKAGEFKAFSAVCTHQGCLVSSVRKTIDCSCHGSSFSLEDGSVEGGPAPRPLAEKTVTVSGSSLTVS